MYGSTRTLSWRTKTLFVLVGTIAAILVGFATGGAEPATGLTQKRHPGSIEREESPEPLSPKQERRLLKHRFEEMKQDADQLATLAKELQEEIQKSSENVLSLQVVDKAERIEKLAKRIKNNAKGY